MKTAILIGASGLVGGYCLKALLKNPTYEKVIALVRRPLLLSHPKLTLLLVDFDNLENYRTLIKGDDVYCCIGTTFLKSPNIKEYYKIDFQYPYEIAKIAKENGADFFALVSALSASKTSLLNYSRVKAALEEGIAKLSFESVYVMRPSYLVGKRKEFRLIERIGVTLLKLLKPFLQKRLRKYRTIEAKVVGETMVYCSTISTSGFHILPSDKIQEIYDRFLSSKCSYD